MFKSVLNRTAVASRQALAAGLYRPLAVQQLPAFARQRRLYSTEKDTKTEDQSASKPNQEPPAADEQQQKQVDKEADGSARQEELNKLKEALDKKDKQIKELKDAYLRTLADMENIRNRARVESEQAKSFAIQKFAKDLLDTVDVLQMALKSVPEEMQRDKENHKTLADFFEGVSLTRSNLLKTLNRHGVEELKLLGEKYDPNTSQALYQVHMPDKEPGTVFAVEKSGYLLNGRVIRPAQVG
ncbi:GrpE, mitochondrial, partial [Spiromyces aspiralis]